jgi:hypothetical protein
MGVVVEAFWLTSRVAYAFWWDWPEGYVGRMVVEHVIIARCSSLNTTTFYLMFSSMNCFTSISTARFLINLSHV